MFDITMCGGRNCIIKEHCKRYTTNMDGFYQSTFVKPPFKVKHKLFSCEFFLGDKRVFLLEQLKKIVNGGKEN